MTYCLTFCKLIIQVSEFAKLEQHPVFDFMLECQLVPNLPDLILRSIHLLRFNTVLHINFYFQKASGKYTTNPGKQADKFKRNRFNQVNRTI